MLIFKALPILLTAVPITMAAISGKVTDTSGTMAIPGAVVKLERGGQQVTTDSGGNFSIDAASSGFRGRNGLQPIYNLSATMRGNLLLVNLREMSGVEIVACNLAGRSIATIRRTMEAGEYSLALPRRAQSVYLYRIRAGSDEVVLISAPGAGGGEAHAGAKMSPTTTATAINDVIKVTKNGYLNHRMLVTNSDTAGIVIKMIASTTTVTDVDGNVYESVTIGTQTWMAENLKTTKYNDGSAIPVELNNSKWSNLRTPAYCWYGNNSAANKDTYGALYNWYAVSTGKLAPEGWHVALDSEWNALVTYLGGTTLAGGPLKEAGMIHWNWGTVNAGATNETGFSALPGGMRTYVGDFSGMNLISYLWSSSNYSEFYAMAFSINCNTRDVQRMSLSKWLGFSVRCVKD